MLLTLTLLLTPAATSAQENVDEARREFEQAETEFGRANYALALRGFERSYELLVGHPRRPLVLYNIGRCYEELGRYREARDAYTRYLREAGDDAVQREETEARVRELETRVSMNAADAPQAARSTTSGTDAASSSPPEATATGGPSPVGPIVLGVGTAMLVAGAITGGVTLANRGDLTAMCDEEMRCPSSGRSLAEDINTLALTTDILLIGGAAIAAAGVILTLVLQDENPSDSVAMSCDDNGCVAMVRGEFQ